VTSKRLSGEIIAGRLGTIKGKRGNLKRRLDPEPAQGRREIKRQIVGIAFITGNFNRRVVFGGRGETDEIE
jgi:hypothetical protein